MSSILIFSPWFLKKVAIFSWSVSCSVYWSSCVFAIKSGEFLGYSAAAVLSDDFNEKFAYMLLAAENFDDLSKRDIYAMLETENFVPPPNLDEIKRLTNQFRKDIFDNN